VAFQLILWIHSHTWYMLSVQSYVVYDSDGIMQRRRSFTGQTSNNVFAIFWNVVSNGSRSCLGRIVAAFMVVSRRVCRQQD